MSILYMINKSPFTSNAFDCLMETIEKQSSSGLKVGVIMIQDAVIIAKNGAGKDNYKFYDTISPLIDKGAKFYALTPDLESRAITSLSPGIKSVSYDEWIDLLEVFDKLMSVT